MVYGAFWIPASAGMTFEAGTKLKARLMPRLETG